MLRLDLWINLCQRRGEKNTKFVVICRSEGGEKLHYVGVERSEKTGCISRPIFKSEWRSRGAAVATSISLGEQILTLRHIKELGLKDIFEKSRQYFRNRRTQYASAKVLNFSVRFWPNAPKLFFPVAEFKALEDLRLKIFYRRIR
ncbi:hypothetical protein F8388_008279 [Cannabis sativa]|uniref:Uncharacterized protein n=1 Tax=Cannabis sativa TaxID=3483 RepID=A0A7J6EMP7_CANSA|nr:hypothetical protein F8388_008279 [Cannabis sativa]